MIVRIAYDVGLSPSSLREWLCNLLLESPDPSNWSEFPNVDNEVQGLLAGAEWFQVYDFIEVIVHSLGGPTNPTVEKFTDKLKRRIPT